MPCQVVEQPRQIFFISDLRHLNRLNFSNSLSVKVNLMTSFKNSITLILKSPLYHLSGENCKEEREK